MTVTLVLVGLAVIFGLLFGSFANVPIHRWPSGGTVTSPSRSACPTCETTIAARDNIPVVSWLLLRGKCRHCQAPIAVRYTLVEVAVAALWVGVVLVWGVHPLTPALLVFTWSLVVASAIDLEHRIIPNRLTYRLPLILLVLVTFAAWQQDAWADLQRAAFAGVGIPVFLALFAELFRAWKGKAGMGMGDIKLSASLGLVVGYLGGMELVVFAYGTIIAAVIIVVALLATGRAKMASKIPFGPYLAVGALIPVFAGPQSVRIVERVLYGA